VVGQAHLLSAGSPLRRLVEGDQPMSLILFGPPGSGKTTLALIVSSATNRRFVQMSALNAGVKDVRAVIEDARRELNYSGSQTVLFIDEIHRFSKTQQDSLLGAVETRTITLVAATTENPFFSIVSPLLSRSSPFADLILSTATNWNRFIFARPLSSKPLPPGSFPHEMELRLI